MLNAAGRKQASELLAAAQGQTDGWLTAQKAKHQPQAAAEEVRAWRAVVNGLAKRYRDLSVVVPDDPLYPRCLTNAPGHPALLFVRGEFGPLDGAVAIVGSRSASEEALAAASEMGSAIADTGRVVVSGLARGIDTAGHLGALAVEGRTVAVLGTGIDEIFPPENSGLVECIVEDGAVVSQFPPNAGYSKTGFPSRNAVIAGLAAATLVMEAEERSGTRIAMGRTLELDKPVLLWGPTVGQKPWARELAGDNPLVEVVETSDEILAASSLSSDLSAS